MRFWGEFSLPDLYNCEKRWDFIPKSSVVLKIRLQEVMRSIPFARYPLISDAACQFANFVNPLQSGDLILFISF
jgi:hypothetical protein